VFGVDHLVLSTNNIERTVSRFESVGLGERRRCAAPSNPAKTQVFFWAGRTILELLGPTDPKQSTGSTQFWGLALSSDDLDHTADVLGELLGTSKDAVQQGREIATLRTEDCDISVPIAILSPHPASGIKEIAAQKRAEEEPSTQ